MEKEIINLICQKLRSGHHYNALIEDLQQALLKLQDARQFIRAVEESQYDPT